MSDNPCKWHEVPVISCLTCNNTPSNVYFLKHRMNDQAQGALVYDVSSPEQVRKLLEDIDHED